MNLHIGNLYPANSKARDFTFDYSKRFNSVEINSTFYHTPSANTLEQWIRRTPSKFTFSAKLTESQFEPLLIQLPPQFKPDKFKVLRYA